MIGTLYGVGVGPGDPELITLKAIRIIKECDVIAAPKTGSKRQVAFHIACQAIPGLDESKVVDIDFPMSAEREKRLEHHQKAANQVLELMEQGKNVAFLTLGDPSIYSTFTYVQNRVKEKGYETLLVPGVPSFCAVAARLNQPLVVDGEALHVIPGSYDTLDSELEWKGTRVLMKTARSMEKVRSALKSHGLYDNAKMVQKCGMEGERVFTDLEQADDSAVYFSIIVAKDEKEGSK